MTSMLRRRVFALVLALLAAVALSGCTSGWERRADHSDCFDRRVMSEETRPMGESLYVAESYDRTGSEAFAGGDVDTVLNELDAALLELEGVLCETEGWEVDLP